MSGNLNRTSRDLKQIFDDLDNKEDGDQAIKDADVAIEAEAIKQEVAAARAG